MTAFANAFAERWVRSVKSECLSRMILFGEESLRRALLDYCEHYHAERPHQGMGNLILFPEQAESNTRDGPITCRERLGGLLKFYRSRGRMSLLTISLNHIDGAGPLDENSYLDLRVSHQRFFQELKRYDRVIAGCIDSRFSGPALDPLAERMDYDPFFSAIEPAFTAAFFSYLRADLGVDTQEEYVRSARGLDWDWKHRQPGTGRPNDLTMPMTNTVPDLALAMTMNPGLHVLVHHGRFDLATPFLAMKYDLDHLDIPPEARARVQIRYYEAGHMMYVHEPSAQAFRESLVSFIRETDRL